MLRHPLLLFLLFCLLLCSLPATAQKAIRISGSILQPDKTTPVPGANVIKFSTKTGVVSDDQGKFLIDMQQEDTLLIRAIGYKPVLYVPSKLPVSELRVKIVLQEDSVMLGEVEVTIRPSQEMIERAMRNMKQPQVSQAKKPGYIPPAEEPAPPTPVAPTAASPISMLYEMLSKDGKERAKLQQLIQQLEKEQRLKEAEEKKKEYNRFFKDNTGYE
ncbi:carboxypeptidase-like regulatory domain-containing protein [Botryobacter ruber]|uniref:carboxypeptidase-like regulatory domain-containing protein n=1 Tax=Botryobacter ruber TaxID=2171629 RepID=UPI000E0AED33|nr:carboxypeptidase-like regulatory domain-containing protein [Botryobacter ruber]